MAWSTSAIAQTKPPKIEDLTEAQRDTLVQKLDRARILYEEKLYGRSLKALNEAYALFPHPDVLYRIAECEEKLGKNAEAVQHYEQILQTTTKSADKEKLSKKIAALKQQLELKKTKLTVTTIPSGATITVADKTYGPTPQELSLAPGEYNVQIIKKGYLTSTQKVLIARGEQTAITVTLKKKAKPQEVALTKDSPIPTSTYVLGGVGIASTITASIFWVLYSNASSEVANIDIQKEKIQRPVDYDDKVNTRNTYGTVAIATTGVAAVTLAGALIAWYIHDPADAPPSKRMVWSPWFDRNAAGVGVMTEF